MTSSLRQGFLGMLFVITLCMAISFKSVKLALVRLIPNVVPLLLGLATLTILGWHLSLVPAMILTLGLGLVVDDTIHLLVNYREQLGRGGGGRESIRCTLVGAGEAVIVTFLAAPDWLRRQLGERLLEASKTIARFQRKQRVIGPNSRLF